MAYKLPIFSLISVQISFTGQPVHQSMAHFRPNVQVMHGHAEKVCARKYADGSVTKNKQRLKEALQTSYLQNAVLSKI